MSQSMLHLLCIGIVLDVLDRHIVFLQVFDYQNQQHISHTAMSKNNL